MSNPRASSVALGMALMTIAMLIVPVVDGLAKQLSQEYSPLTVSWMRYLGGVFYVLPLTLIVHRKQAWPSKGLGSQFARTLFLVGAMTLFFTAISTVPLADATAAYLLAPVVASVLAVIVLGEAFSRRKAIAVALGLLGALIVVRPGFSTEPGMLYALSAGVLFACYIIATRKAANTASPLVTLNFQYTVGALVLTPIGLITFTMPTQQALLIVALMGVVSLAAHGLSILAFRYALASTLSPLLYVELIGSVAVGYWLFGDLPSALTWIGILVIVTSGLLLLAKERPQTI